LQTGHGGGGDGGPIGQAIIGQASPVVQGGGQGGGHEGAVVLVGVPVALTVQGGGQATIAGLLAGSGFTGTRGIRTLLVSCRAPCRLCLFEWLWWRR
jgi:hypothetical protein